MKRGVAKAMNQRSSDTMLNNEVMNWKWKIECERVC